MTDDERRQQELEEETPVTVTFHLSEERMEHLLQHSDYLSGSSSLSIEECTVFSILDKICSSAAKQGLYMKEKMEKEK